MNLQYDDDWKRRDVLGIHPQRQEGLYWVGALIPVGRLHSDDMDALAEVADRLAFVKQSGVTHSLNTSERSVLTANIASSNRAVSINIAAVFHSCVNSNWA